MTKSDYGINKVISDNDFDLAWRLRYDAFMRIDGIVPSEDQMFRDKWDHAPNVSSYLLHLDKAPDPIGTIRAAVYADDFDWLPTPGAEAYADIIREKLGPKTPYVESSRFAMAEIGGRSLMRAHLYMFRVLTIKAIKHQCDWIITAINAKYLSYYQKTMGMRQLSEARDLPGFTYKNILIGSEFNHQTLEASSKVNPYFADLLAEYAQGRT